MIDFIRIFINQKLFWSVDARKRFVMISLLAILSACAAAPSKGKIEDIVAQRAQQRWDLMIKGDLPAAYAFLSPASRSTVSLDAFQSRNKPGYWKKTVVKEVVCEAPDLCDAKMELTYDLRDLKDRIQEIQEKWTLDEGQWWLVYRARR